MNDNNGFLPLHDQSESKEIIALLKMTKKTFNKATILLHKLNQVRLEEDGIYLA